LTLSQIVAPLPVILQPTNGTLFAGGQNLSFSGAATDFSGAALAPSAFTWSGEFHSNGSAFAAFGPVSGQSNGSYLVPTNDTATNVFYRVYLTVSDSKGNQQTASQDVQPQTSQLSFETVPPGLQVTLDDQPLMTTTSLTAVVGMTRQVAAPSPQLLGGTNYQFVVWSDGGAAAHAVSVPPTNSMFTASFLAPNLGLDWSAGNIQLTWPAWAGAMKLYSTADLTPPASWALVTNVPVRSGGVYSLALPATNGLEFYRLELP